MRVLKISDVYFPRVNGVSTSIRTFARELQAQGHEVTLIAPAYPEPFDDSFEILRIPSRYLPMDPEDRLMKTAQAKKLLQELRQRQFDVIHVHTPFAAHYFGLWLRKQLNIPVIETYHTYFEEYLEQYLPWIPRRFLRYTARHFSRSQCKAVDHLVVPTQPMLEVLRNYGIDTAASVIPTGIPAGAFSTGNGSRFRERMGIAAERPMLLYVGRVAHEKNIDFLLDVTAAVRRQRNDVLLVIAGEGPALSHLKQKAQRDGLSNNVMFVGYLSRQDDLPDCYAAGDLFIFASATETQGLVLLEAMQAGTPVVTTAVMGTAAVMADRRGGLIANEDIQHFSQAVLTLLDSPAMQQQHASEAVIKAREWSAPATTSDLVTVYSAP